MIIFASFRHLSITFILICSTFFILFQLLPDRSKFNVKDKVWYVERGKGQETIDAIKDYLQQHDEGMYLKIPEEVSSEQFRDIIKQFTVHSHNICQFSLYLLCRILPPPKHLLLSPDGRTYIDFLPESMTNEQSDQIVAHLKSIGAKFDPEVGQWYVEKDWQMPQFEQQNEKENQNFRNTSP